MMITVRGKQRMMDGSRGRTPRGEPLSDGAWEVKGRTWEQCGCLVVGDPALAVTLVSFWALLGQMGFKSHIYISRGQSSMV